MNAITDWLRKAFTTSAHVPAPQRPEQPAAPAIPAAPAVSTSARFQACLTEVLRHEGGFVNNPADPGGATNMGITLATLSNWRGRPVSVAEVREISKAEASAIYRARYWNAVQGDLLPPGVDLAVFDFAVNSGPGRAIKALQGILGVAQDGAMGPATRAALDRAAGPVSVITALCDARLKFLHSLGTWQTFGRGWTKRIDDVEDVALRMTR